VAECDALSDAEFLFIPGFEVPYRRAHILMLGARTFHGQYAPTVDALDPWCAAAACVVLAHPVRNQFVVEPALATRLQALEVWNQQYDGKRVPRVRSLSLYQELKAHREDLRALGGVDLHRSEHVGAPVLTLSVDTLTADAVLGKITQGAFTVSSEQVWFYGSLPDAAEVAATVRWQSHLSVCIITIGKWVNATLARWGIRLPKGLAKRVRRSL
jgi:hypothetical protein